MFPIVYLLNFYAFQLSYFLQEYQQGFFRKHFQLDFLNFLQIQIVLIKKNFQSCQGFQNVDPYCQIHLQQLFKNSFKLYQQLFTPPLNLILIHIIENQINQFFKFLLIFHHLINFTSKKLVFFHFRKQDRHKLKNYYI